MNRLLKVSTLSALAIILLAFFTAPAQAVNYVWNLPAGDDFADNASLWYAPDGTTGTVPGAADWGIVKTPGLMKIDTATLPWPTGSPLGRLYVGNRADEPNTYVVPASEGHVQQTSGDFEFVDYIILNYLGPGTSTYDMQGGSITGTGRGELRIADRADATMTVSGSSIMDMKLTRIGYGIGEAPATGSLTMSGTSSLTTGDLIVAYGESLGPIDGPSNGTLELFDSASVSSTTAIVGLWNGSHGEISLHDSSFLSVSGLFKVGDSQPSETINPTGGHGALNIADDATVSVEEFRVGDSSAGDGELNIASGAGTASLGVSSTFSIGSSGGTGVMNIGAGADITQTAGDLRVGYAEFEGARGDGTVTMDGGVFDRSGSTGTFYLGYSGADGVWTQNDGTFLNNDAAVIIGRAAYNAGSNTTLNLNGGIFEAASMQTWEYYGDAPTSSTVNLNGGMLRSTGGGLTLFDGGAEQVLQAVVQSGGALVDTNGFDVNVGVGLTDGGGGGGLTKQGAGVLTLRGANTYTGATNVTAGDLALSSTGSVATSDIVMADGSNLSLPGASAVTGPLNMFRLGAGSTMETALTSTGGTAADTITTTTLDLSTGVTLRIGAQGGSLDTTTPYTIISQGSNIGAGTTATTSAVSLVRGTTAVATVNPTNVTVAISGTATAASLEWSGAGTDWETLGAANNWTNLAGPNPDIFYELDNVAFNDNGLANPAVNVVGRVHPASIDESGTTSYTFSGTGEIVGATTTLTKTGTGTFRFDNSGGVSLGGAVSLGGGVLSVGSQSGDNTLSGDVSLSAGVAGGVVLDAQAQATLRLSGVVSDDGVTGLTKTGPGALVLGNSANTYTGVTTIHEGVVMVDNLANGGLPSSIGASSADPANLRFATSAHGVLQYTGPDATTDRGFGLDGGYGWIHTDSNLTMTGGVQSSSGYFYKNGDGTLTLESSGSNTIGSRLYIYGGDIVLDGPANTQFDVNGQMYAGNSSGQTVGLTIQGDAFLNITDDIYAARDGSDFSLTMTENAHIYVADYTGIGLDGGDGVVTMSGNALLDTRYGRIGGQLQGATPGTVDMVLSDKARIQAWGAWLNVGEQFYTTTVTLNDEASMASLNAHMDVGYGRETDCTIVMNGSSDITTATGVYIGVNGFFASGHVTMNDDSTMTTGRIDIGSNGDSGRNTSGTLILNDNATVVATNAVAVGNDDASDGLLMMSGNSLMTVTNWIAVGNVYDGANGHGSGEAFLSDNAKIIALDHLEVAYGGIGIVHLGDGTPGDNAVISSQVNPVILGWGTGGMDTEARVDLNVGGTLEAVGTITGNDGGGLEPLSSVINFNGGLLRALADNADFMTNVGGSLIFEANVMAPGANIDTNGFNIGFSLGLTEDGGSPGGGLTKTGAGTLTLGGVNTYTGLTSILEGTLAVDGSIPGDVDVASGAALGGGGTVGGNVNVAPGGSVGPGSSIGILNVVGDMSLAGSLDVEYDSDNDMIDLLNVSGELDLTGGSLDFSDLGSSELTNGVYVLATYGTLVGDPVTENGLDTEFMSVDYNYMGSKSIALVKVPEPSTLVLALLGLLFVGFRKRR